MMPLTGIAILPRTWCSTGRVVSKKQNLSTVFDDDTSPRKVSFPRLRLIATPHKKKSSVA